MLVAVEGNEPSTSCPQPRLYGISVSQFTLTSTNRKVVPESFRFLMSVSRSPGNDLAKGGSSDVHLLQVRVWSRGFIICIKVHEAVG